MDWGWEWAEKAFRAVLVLWIASSLEAGEGHQPGMTTDRFCCTSHLCLHEPPSSEQSGYLHSELDIVIGGKNILGYLSKVA